MNTSVLAFGVWETEEIMSAFFVFNIVIHGW